MKNYCESPQRSDVHQVLGIHDLKVWDQTVSLEQRLRDLESRASVSKKLSECISNQFLTQITFRI